MWPSFCAKQSYDIRCANTHELRANVPPILRPRMVANRGGSENGARTRASWRTLAEEGMFHLHQGVEGVAEPAHSHPKLVGSKPFPNTYGFLPSQVGIPHPRSVWKNMLCNNVKTHARFEQWRPRKRCTVDPRTTNTLCNKHRVPEKETRVSHTHAPREDTLYCGNGANPSHSGDWGVRTFGWTCLLIDSERCDVRNLDLGDLRSPLKTEIPTGTATNIFPIKD